MLQSYFLVCAAGHGIKPGRIRCGVTYGLRKTRIPLLSVLIISLCSGLVLGASMQAGALLAVLIPIRGVRDRSRHLILLGLWSLYQQVRRKSESDVRRFPVRIFRSPLWKRRHLTIK